MTPTDLLTALREQAEAAKAAAEWFADGEARMLEVHRASRLVYEALRASIAAPVERPGPKLVECTGRGGARPGAGVKPRTAVPACDYRERRRKLGLSRRQLAAAIGVPEGRLAEWERPNRHATPNGVDAARWEAALAALERGRG